MRASFIYHQITAIFSVIGTILSLFYLITRFKEYPKYLVGIIFILLAIAWGVHSIVHFLEESIYHFDPASGKNKVVDNPVPQKVIITNRS